MQDLNNFGYFRRFGGDANKVEPLTLAREYPAQWIRPRIDVNELARLRREGLSYSKIARKFERSKARIIALLQRAARKNAMHC